MLRSIHNIDFLKIDVIKVLLLQKCYCASVKSVFSSNGIGLIEPSAEN